jgi:hypothetical protein
MTTIGFWNYESDINRINKGYLKGRLGYKLLLSLAHPIPSAHNPPKSNIRVDNI